MSIQYIHTTSLISSNYLSFSKRRALSHYSLWSPMDQVNWLADLLVLLVQPISPVYGAPAQQNFNYKFSQLAWEYYIYPFQQSVDCMPPIGDDGRFRVSWYLAPYIIYTIWAGWIPTIQTQSIEQHRRYSVGGSVFQMSTYIFRSGQLSVDMNDHLIFKTFSASQYYLFFLIHHHMVQVVIPSVDLSLITSHNDAEMSARLCSHHIMMQRWMQRQIRRAIHVKGGDEAAQIHTILLLSRHQLCLHLTDYSLILSYGSCQLAS